MIFTTECGIIASYLEEEAESAKLLSAPVSGRLAAVSGQQQEDRHPWIQLSRGFEDIAVMKSVLLANLSTEYDEVGFWRVSASYWERRLSMFS